MDEKKVDIWEFEQAVAYMDSDPIKANSLFEKYIEGHPKDYIAYTYYASTYIIVGEFDKAEKVLNHAQELVKDDEEFQTFKTRVEYFEKMSTFTRVKILSYKEQYKTLNDNFNAFAKKLKNLPINDADFVSRIKTGNLEESKRERMGGYIFKQLFEYKEADFRDHIKKHLYEYNASKDYEHKEMSVFSQDFPLDKVLEEVKKHMDGKKALYFGFVENTYVFKYDFCGKSEHKNANYFKVITIHGTNNIISMFPVSGDLKLPYTDLNYIQENNNSKKKGISQIDKFNRRYKR